MNVFCRFVQQLFVHQPVVYVCKCCVYLGSLVLVFQNIDTQQCSNI